jgi:hypothetical protein
MDAYLSQSQWLASMLRRRRSVPRREAEMRRYSIPAIDVTRIVYWTRGVGAAMFEGVVRRRAVEVRAQSRAERIRPSSADGPSGGFPMSPAFEQAVETVLKHGRKHKQFVLVPAADVAVLANFCKRPAPGATTKTAFAPAPRDPAYEREMMQLFANAELDP